MNASPQKLTLVGCGNMGGALLEIWATHFADTQFSVLDPSGLPEKFQGRDNIKYLSGTQDLPGPDLVVLAVKPQIMDSVLADLKPHVKTRTLVLSIAAGQKLSKFESVFDEMQPIIRVMPNTPSAVGAGMSVGIANSLARDDHKAITQSLFEASGVFEWIDDETLMDAVTAVSGSGPAYIFYLIEVLQRAAQDVGFEKNLAEKLARQTVIGAAMLAQKSPDIPAATLRENVTSPGGTTEAALEVLMNGEMEKLFIKAVKAAMQRGKDLGA